MGLWNHHGMYGDEDEIAAGIDALGLMPEELEMLSDFSKEKVWVYEQMRKREKGQTKRKLTLMTGFWRRRARKFKELAAAEEDFYARERGEEVEIPLDIQPRD